MSTVVAEAAVLIERPIEDVFAFVSDPNNETSWHIQILEIRSAAGGAEQSGLPNSWTQGSLWTVTAGFMGRRMDSEVEVTRFEPNRRIEFTSRTGPLLPIATCLFEGTDGGTLFTAAPKYPSRGSSGY